MLTTCKHFDIVGNRCSRVTGGKCDDLPDCEFKYIEALKAENAKLIKNAEDTYDMFKALMISFEISKYCSIFIRFHIIYIHHFKIRRI